VTPSLAAARSADETVGSSRLGFGAASSAPVTRKPHTEGGTFVPIDTTFDMSLFESASDETSGSYFNHHQQQQQQRQQQQQAPTTTAHLPLRIHSQSNVWPTSQATKHSDASYAPISSLYFSEEDFALSSDTSQAPPTSVRRSVSEVLALLSGAKTEPPSISHFPKSAETSKTIPINGESIIITSEGVDPPAASRVASSSSLPLVHIPPVASLRKEDRKPDPAIELRQMVTQRTERLHQPIQHHQDQNLHIRFPSEAECSASATPAQRHAKIPAVFSSVLEYRQQLRAAIVELVRSFFSFRAN
jgi:hypothetical protein